MFLCLLLILESIQQAALVNFMLFLNMFLKILKISFWRKNCVSFDLWALFSWEPWKALRIAQCKQRRLVKPCLIEFNNERMIRSKGLLKAVFVTNKVIKNQTSSAWDFLQPPIPVYRGACIPYFKINVPIFCCPPFSENYLLKIISTLVSGSTKW